jgi:hypothetical protein
VNYSGPERFDDIWEENLFCSAHASQWAYTEDYADLTSRAERVIDRAKVIRYDRYKEIAGNIPYTDKNVAVVFNMHDKAVRRAIRSTITTPDPKKLVLTDAFGKKLDFIPVQPYVFSFMETVVFEWDFIVVLDIPANGYNSIIAEEGRLDVIERIPWSGIEHPVNTSIDFAGGEKVSIENKVIRLDFDQKGLVCITDKKSSKTTGNCGVYNEISFREYSDKRINMPVNEIKETHKIKWERAELLRASDLLSEIVIYGIAGMLPVKQIIRLFSDIPEIYLETEIDITQGRDGIVLLNMHCDDIESLYAGIPFGIEPRRVDKEPYLLEEYFSGWDDIGGKHRTIDGLFYAKDFIAFTEGELSLSLTALSGDRYFIYDKENKKAGHIANATTGLTDGWEQHINSTAFSSYGKHVFDHVISVFDGNTELYEVQQNAEGLRCPPEYVRPLCKNSGTTLPFGKSFISAADNNVRISAIYRENNEFVLRVWEAAGRETVSSVDLPFVVKSVRKTDFNSLTVSDSGLSAEGSKINFTLAPCEIVTFNIVVKIA